MKKVVKEAAGVLVQPVNRVGWTKMIVKLTLLYVNINDFISYFTYSNLSML